MRTIPKDNESQKWKLLVVLLIITLAIVVSSYQSQISQRDQQIQALQKQQTSSTLLQKCMDDKVSPLETQAAIAPSIYKQGSIEEATNSCKLQYPN